MSQLFTKSADAAARVFWIGVALLLIGAPLFLMWWVRTPYVTGQAYAARQPVPFDHRHHVVDDRIACLYCHTEAERSPHAGVPATDVCMNCHSQIWNDSPLLAAVWASERTRRPITWQRVTYLPGFVYFNHAIHLRKGVGCETCHGRVDRMARVVQVAPLTMGWCLDCHRAPEQYLRPRDDVTTMGYRPSRDQQVLGPELARQYGVRRVTTCTACHR